MKLKKIKKSVGKEKTSQVNLSINNESDSINLTNILF